MPEGEGRVSFRDVFYTEPCSWTGELTMIRAIIILTAGIAFILMSPVVAQTTAPMKQQHLGNSFDDAEKWAKVFDDPQRDSWQKPDEVLDALHLKAPIRSPTSALVPAISAFESPSVCWRAKSSQSTSNQTCCAILASGRTVNI